MITKEQYRWISDKQFFGCDPRAIVHRNAQWLDKHPSDGRIRNETINGLLALQYEHYFLKRVLGRP